MTSSKEHHFESLRRNRPAPAELPALDHDWTTYADRRAKFIEVLELVGGKAIVARDACTTSTSSWLDLPQICSRHRKSLR